MKISVVLPTLNEAQELPAALASVRQQVPAAHQILVVDGGSSDGTQALARREAELLVCAAGRARQQNAGLARATGEVVLFLHADCRLPPGALAAVSQALRDEEVVGGAFHKRFRSESLLLRDTRRRTATWFRFGALFGDQALFVRRAALQAAGGFREEVVAEDLDLVLRLGHLQPLVLLPQEVLASARRLEERGIMRTWLSWWWAAFRTWVHARKPTAATQREALPTATAPAQQNSPRPESGTLS